MYPFDQIRSDSFLGCHCSPAISLREQIDHSHEPSPDQHFYGGSLIDPDQHRHENQYAYRHFLTDTYPLTHPHGYGHYHLDPHQQRDMQLHSHGYEYGHDH